MTIINHVSILQKVASSNWLKDYALYQFQRLKLCDVCKHIPFSLVESNHMRLCNQISHFQSNIIGN